VVRFHRVPFDRAACRDKAARAGLLAADDLPARGLGERLLAALRRLA
jgi:hypothetical protein